jgi:hypothetical protein
MADEPRDTSLDEDPALPAKRPYVRPVLTEFGSVATLTGGSRTRNADGPGGGFKKAQ